MPWYFIPRVLKLAKILSSLFLAHQHGYGSLAKCKWQCFIWWSRCSGRRPGADPREGEWDAPPLAFVSVADRRLPQTPVMPHRQLLDLHLMETSFPLWRVLERECCHSLVSVTVCLLWYRRGGEEIRRAWWWVTHGEVEGWSFSEFGSGSGWQLASRHNECLRRWNSSRQPGRSRRTNPRRWRTLGGMIMNIVVPYELYTNCTIGEKFRNFVELYNEYDGTLFEYLTLWPWTCHVFCHTRG